MNYTSIKAVDDWIEIEIQTVTPTNFDTIRKCGGIDHVTAFNEDWNNFPRGRENSASSRFRFRIQDPTPIRARAILAKLEAKCPFSVPPKLTGHEIAVDLYRDGATREEYAGMVIDLYRLAAFMPSANRRLYRDYKGSGMAIPTDRNSFIRHLLDGYQMGVGNEHDNYFLHAYFKELDASKPDEVCEPRARFEFRLRGAGLPYQTVDEWAAFKSTAFASKFFRFMKVMDGKGQQYRDLVIQVGERKLRRRMNADGTDYSGTRLHSASVVADSDLNEDIRQALRKLDRARISTRTPQRKMETLSPSCADIPTHFERDNDLSSSEDAYSEEPALNTMYRGDVIPSPQVQILKMNETEEIPSTEEDLQNLGGAGEARTRYDEMMDDLLI